MYISVVTEQWGQGFHLESNGDKGCVWRKGREVREGREGGVGLASGRKTRKQRRRKVKNTPDSR